MIFQVLHKPKIETIIIFKFGSTIIYFTLFTHLRRKEYNIFGPNFMAKICMHVRCFWGQKLKWQRQRAKRGHSPIEGGIKSVDSRRALHSQPSTFASRVRLADNDP